MEAQNIINQIEVEDSKIKIKLIITDLQNAMDDDFETYYITNLQNAIDNLIEIYRKLIK